MTAEIEILGCGPSTGTPGIGCSCAICSSNSPFNKRLRASARLITASKSILIDASPDLRQQALRSPDFKELDAVLFTHAHSDHILGLSELRSFYFINQQAIPLYSTKATAKELKQVFHYIFEPDKDYLGMLPKFQLHEFTLGDSLLLDDLKIQSFALDHGGMEVSGFQIGNLSYATDVKAIPDESKKIISGSEILILGALSDIPHPSHLSIAEAIAVAEEMNIKNLYLTHLGHTIDYFEVEKNLPSWVKLCYDGMKINFDFC